jgi:hypothetical protein
MSMTWQQFKESVNVASVPDDAVIEWIDVGHPHYHGSGESDLRVVVAEPDAGQTAKRVRITN